MAENLKPIGQNTPITIGVIVAFLGVFSTGIWWASSISTKIDQVIRNQQTNDTLYEKNTVALKLLEDRVRSIELIGSPSMSQKMSSVEARILALENKNRVQ